HGDLQNATYLGAWALTSLGVLLVAPWVGRRGASLIGRIWRDAGLWLGARRLAFDGRAASRVTLGVVAVVFAASVAAGLLVIVDPVDAGSRIDPRVLRPSTVVVDGVHLSSAADELVGMD